MGVKTGKKLKRGAPGACVWMDGLPAPGGLEDGQGEEERVDWRRKLRRRRRTLWSSRVAWTLQSWARRTVSLPLLWQ